MIEAVAGDEPARTEPAAGPDGDGLHPSDRELARRVETGTGELRLDLAFGFVRLFYPHDHSETPG